MIMGSKCHLPFETGQEAESKCFIKGFRGAWFRCKINKIRYQKRQIGYHLEYFDYPDEKKEWVSAYQKPPHKESKMELVMRPSFPLICHESQLHAFPESDVIAVISGTWKVGDLVDWWSENCYWSGKIIRVAGKDKVEIQLPNPPIGEGGSSYEASCKDLRPSLDWSPESGWTVPLSMEAGNSWQCARLIWLHSEEKEWVSAYQKPPQAECKMELVMRPSFPLICHESQLHAFLESDVIAVISGTWKVVDLVDWWCEDCYWSGRII